VTTIIRDREVIDRAVQHGVISLTEAEALNAPREDPLQPGDTLTLAQPAKGGDGYLPFARTVRLVALVESDKVLRGGPGFLYSGTQPLRLRTAVRWVLPAEFYDSLDLSLPYVAVIEPVEGE
jgi:hypothetical protein